MDGMLYAGVLRRPYSSARVLVDGHDAVVGAAVGHHRLGLDVGVLNVLGPVLPLDDHVRLGKAATSPS